MRLMTPLVIVGGAALLQGCAALCAPSPGDTCTAAEAETAYCEGGEVVVGCRNGKWQSAEELSQSGLGCNCAQPADFDVCTPQALSCPVPGFVGIAEAQRDVSNARPVRSMLMLTEAIAGPTSQQVVEPA